MWSRIGVVVLAVAVVACTTRVYTSTIVMTGPRHLTLSLATAQDCAAACDTNLDCLSACPDATWLPGETCNADDKSQLCIADQSGPYTVQLHGRCSEHRAEYGAWQCRDEVHRETSWTSTIAVLVATVVAVVALALVGGVAVVR